MDFSDIGEKILTSQERKISKALQIVRRLMAELNHVTVSQSEFETEIVLGANNDSVTRQNAMLKAASLPARAETLSDLATALFILIQLERQNLGLDYIACPDTYKGN